MFGENLFLLEYIDLSWLTLGPFWLIRPVGNVTVIFV